MPNNDNRAGKWKTVLALLASTALGGGPAPSYSLGVIAAGIQTAADHKATPPGPRTALTSTVGVTSLPAGCTINSPYAGCVLIDTTGRTITFNNWDCRLYNWKIIGTGSVTFTDCSFKPLAASVDYTLESGGQFGSASGTPTVVMNYIDFDGTGSGVDGGGIRTIAGTLTITNIHIHDTASTPLQLGASFSMTDFYAQRFGFNSNNGVPGDPADYDHLAGTHLDFAHFLFGGTYVFRRGVIDLLAHPGNISAGYSNMFAVYGFSGDVNLTLDEIECMGIDDNVVPWGPAPGVDQRQPNWFLQIETASGYNVVATVTQMAVEPGAVDWFNASFAGGGTLSYTGSNNYDRATGTAIAEMNTTITSSDTTPSAFSFTDNSAAALSTSYTSNSIEVLGIDAASPISVTGGEYRINGGSWTSTAGTVVLNDDVEVRGTSSGSNSTAVNVVLTIGGVSDTFTITTVAGGGGDANAHWDTSTEGANIAITGSDLIATLSSADGTSRNVRGLKALPAYCYWQMTFHAGLGGSASSNGLRAGVCNSTTNMNYDLGADSNSAAILYNAIVRDMGGGYFDDPGWNDTPLTDDVVLCVFRGAKLYLLPLSTGVWLGKDSVTDNPLTSTGGAACPGGTVYPAAGLLEAGDSVTLDPVASDSGFASVVAALDADGAVAYGDA